MSSSTSRPSRTSRHGFIKSYNEDVLANGASSTYVNKMNLKDDECVKHPNKKPGGEKVLKSKNKAKKKKKEKKSKDKKSKDKKSKKKRKKNRKRKYSEMMEEECLIKPIGKSTHVNIVVSQDVQFPVNLNDGNDDEEDLIITNKENNQVLSNH